MLIQKISTTKRGYGGNIYEWYLEEFLSTNYNFEKVDLSFHLRGWWRVFEFPIYVLRLLKVCMFPKGFLIRNSQAAFVPMRKGRGLTIVYHIDETLSPLGSRLFQKFMEFGFFLFTRKHDPIVVISKYWEKYFLDHGFTNVCLAYCPFEIEKYQVIDQEVAEFKRKHGFGKRPLIYIGNPQPKKGSHLVYEALKDEDYDLVTSGEGNLVLPKAKHLKLSFPDYVKLLAACDIVITFSQFKEGWCRVAHEAILVGTPVIGSGLGGMEEILVSSGQLVCPDHRNLNAMVRTLLSHGKVTKNGLGWAVSFDLTKFNKDWLRILDLHSSQIIARQTTHT
ncbi:MAG: glycosyltransferase [Bdellovibrionales bacterium]|nr:glycosyltransferase [Bdellovibrionales bacterium]